MFNLRVMFMALPFPSTYPGVQGGHDAAPVADKGAP